MEASATSLRSCAAAAAEAGAAGGPGSACSSTASGAACSERSGRFGSPAGSGSSLDRAQASAVQAAIEAAAHTGASGGSSASSSNTTMKGTLPVPAVVVSLPTLTDVLGRMPDAAADVEHSSCSSSSSSSSSSPRIPASHTAMPAAAAATVPAAVHDSHGRPAGRVTAAPAAARVAGSAPSGSRIKRLGMQAANLREGGKTLPRPEWALSSLPGAVSAQAAAAATPATAAAKAWTPGRQPNRLLEPQRRSFSSSRAGLAKPLSNRGPAAVVPGRSSSVVQHTPSLASHAPSAADAYPRPVADACGPPSGLAPLMLALAVAARPSGAKDPAGSSVP